MSNKIKFTVKNGRVIECFNEKRKFTYFLTHYILPYQYLDSDRYELNEINLENMCEKYGKDIDCIEIIIKEDKSNPLVFGFVDNEFCYWSCKTNKKMRILLLEILEFYNLLKLSEYTVNQDLCDFISDCMKVNYELLTNKN